MLPNNSSVTHETYESALSSALNLADILATYVWSSSAKLATRAELIQSITSLMLEFDKRSHQRIAQEFGKNVTWPAEIFTHDATDLSASGSLENLIKFRQEAAKADRFNEVRCKKVFSSDPEFERLLRIAREGVDVDVSPTFTRLSSPPQRRRIHSNMPGVFIYHAVNLWREGKALLLPTPSLHSENVHFNAVHWTAKPGRPEGRFLGDCSNGPENQSLNTDDVKDMIISRYGELHHPTIVDIIRDIVALGDKVGCLQSLRLWKDDIVGAFSHFNYSPACASLFTFEIDNSLSLVQYTGMFGWTGSPFAFGPISRALGRVVNQNIAGTVHVYVDDFMGISPWHDAHKDQKMTQSLLFDALGPSAVNPLKSSEPALAMDVIGWHICLKSETVRPSNRAIRKIMYSFFSVTCSRRSRVPLDKMQALASLASRYSMALLGLRPFVQPLFENCRVAQHIKWVRLSHASIMAIHMWRAVAVILFSDTQPFAIPLSFLVRSAPVSLRIRSDAGPRCIGVVIDRGCHTSYIAHLSYTLPFDASDPRYQNTREFMGVIIGLLMLAKLGYRNEYIHWIGDNVSSLSWVQHNYVKSSSAQASFLMYSWITIYSHLIVSTTEHCPGINMGDIDGLSRGFATGFDNIRSPLTPEFAIELDPLFLLVDPTMSSDVVHIFNILTSILPLLANIIQLRTKHNP